MRIYISYFYQIRFFKRYMIPLSTAVWDPKWYHAFRGNGNIFKDKNGVYNGLRIEQFMPGKGCNNLCHGSENCESHDPTSCDFLKKYREQLDQLDFSTILNGLIEYSNSIKQIEGFPEDPVIVLIVHEAPHNPCSERRVIQEWFRDNGYILPEWTKSSF